MAKSYKEACEMLRWAVKNGANDYALARYIKDAYEAAEAEVEEGPAANCVVCKALTTNADQVCDRSSCALENSGGKQ